MQSSVLPRSLSERGNFALPLFYVAKFSFSGKYRFYGPATDKYTGPCTKISSRFSPLLYDDGYWFAITKFLHDFISGLVLISFHETTLSISVFSSFLSGQNLNWATPPIIVFFPHPPQIFPQLCEGERASI